MLRVEGPVPATPPEKATVVFLRASGQSKSDTPMYDVTDGRLEFLGNMARRTKLAAVVSPGQHVFMVYDDRHHQKMAGFLNASLTAGKTYYVLLKPRFGDIFGLKPLHQTDISSADFPEWLADTQLLQTAPEASEQAEQNRALVTETRDKYWEAFQRNEHPEEHVLYDFDGVGVDGAEPGIANTAPPAPALPSPATQPANAPAASPPQQTQLPTNPPAAVSAPAGLAVGANVLPKTGAQGHLQPRPGADIVPLGSAPLLLRSRLVNEFGAWWFVTAKQSSMWVAETDLAPSR